MEIKKFYEKCCVCTHDAEYTLRHTVNGEKQDVHYCENCLVEFQQELTKFVQDNDLNKKEEF